MWYHLALLRLSPQSVLEEWPHCEELPELDKAVAFNWCSLRWGQDCLLSLPLHLGFSN